MRDPRPGAATAFLTSTLLALTAATSHAARVDLQPPGVVAPLTGPAAGDPVDLAVGFARARATDLGLVESDFDDARLDSYITQHSGVTHVYLRQRLGGVEVWGGDAAVHVARDGRILKVSSSFAPDLARSVGAREPGLSASSAVALAIAHLGLEPGGALEVIGQPPGPARETHFAPAGVALQPITTRLMYFESDCGEVRLGWNVNLYERGAAHWWNLLLDAETGAVLARHDWVASDSYSVYELPAPSPNHVSPAPPADARVVTLNPADATASPYGWHSTTMTPAQYLATRGNNVDAYEDQDNSNDPTGGDAARAVASPSLDFSFPLDLTMVPASGVDAAITNLFYMNNAIHDILYHYGFDEASGNFQVNNYGRGGDGNDDVQAEAQDGGGRNNANFSTPIDGQRPRMQMYLWDPPRNERLVVNSPPSIAGDYQAASAAFGPRAPLPPGITGKIVVVDDGSANPTWGCDVLVNGAAIAGNIALASAAGCGAGTKAEFAEAAGAIALVVWHFLPGGAPFVLPGVATPSIPTVMVGNIDGERIRAETLVTDVDATIVDPVGGATVDLDCSLDNEIVIHEYGHGVSNRLVGGRLNVDCLNNREQAGEGWSDLLALMLTARPGDTGADIRGLATYSAGQPTTGKGLRSYPYSTDLVRSPLTYADIATEAVPHGVGSVWASMGWEVYWAMTDRYGFDPDLIGGSGGNNMAIRLILDGLKLTPCSPGFVDDRDAVLMADQVDFGGANQCLLWRAFAKRGLGFSARQGSATVLGDETEAFDVPAACVCAGPVEQGNVLRATRSALTDVKLDFVGATGSAWRVFRDPDKLALRATPLTPDAATTSFTDAGAVAIAVGSRLFYRIAEVDCIGDAGP